MSRPGWVIAPGTPRIHAYNGSAWSTIFEKPFHDTKPSAAALKNNGLYISVCGWLSLFNQFSVIDHLIYFEFFFAFPVFFFFFPSTGVMVNFMCQFMCQIFGQRLFWVFPWWWFWMRLRFTSVGWVKSRLPSIRRVSLTQSVEGPRSMDVWLCPTLERSLCPMAVHLGHWHFLVLQRLMAFGLELGHRLCGPWTCRLPHSQEPAPCNKWLYIDINESLYVHTHTHLHIEDILVLCLWRTLINTRDNEKHPIFTVFLTFLFISSITNILDC